MLLVGMVPVTTGIYNLATASDLASFAFGIYDVMLATAHYALSWLVLVVDWDLLPPDSPTRARLIRIDSAIYGLLSRLSLCPRDDQVERRDIEGGIWGIEGMKGRSAGVPGVGGIQRVGQPYLLRRPVNSATDLSSQRDSFTVDTSRVSPARPLPCCDLHA
ncbi:uncharacterized protein DNG_01789 [Cephalotrichum gorgonifer]|uniref:Uncharacterized protein n=1 Tax=Cephalotrichum gorgonifer TaxID=2041049 RepID=A0AAE8MTS4_9PEZI|nr:uncharacterized protein DNG_01789 [Cephalotrichum gorgonifer]